MSEIFKPLTLILPVKFLFFPVRSPAIVLLPLPDSPTIETKLALGISILMPSRIFLASAPSS